VTRSTAKPAAKSARAEPKAKPVASKSTVKLAVKAKPTPVKSSKPNSKPAAKAAPAKAPPSKASSKPAAKAARPAVPPAQSTKGMPPKSAPAPAVNPAAVAKKASPVPMQKPSPKAAIAPAAPVTPVAAPALAAVAPPPLVPAKAPRAKNSAKSRYGAPMPAAPLPPPTSRFADRFAPPRPPTRQMNNLGLDVPRVPIKVDPKLANAWKSKAGHELAEAEVLAMPESEYMNEKQLDYFRATLKKLKDDLLSNAGETTEHLREDTSIVPDPADRATIEEEHALELRTRDRERKLLKKISQSLSRIESGDYGFCDETGEPIGLGRLIARPTATLSLEAQQRRELKQKMFGD
jgi:DnaK suppressor protein